jgi:hypothetical protein
LGDDAREVLPLDERLEDDDEEGEGVSGEEEFEEVI